MNSDSTIVSPTTTRANNAGPIMPVSAASLIKRDEFIWPDKQRSTPVGPAAPACIRSSASRSGHQKFRPRALAKELAHYGVVNLGAAGTFVVRENVSEVKLRDEIMRRLPFKPELMICSARDVLTLTRGNWFADAPAGKDVGRFVSVLQKAPRVKPPLPIEQPGGGKWEVRIVAITGRFALSVRRLGQTYSNAVVEKQFGIAATTRNWNTIEAIREVLDQ